MTLPSLAASPDSPLTIAGDVLVVSARKAKDGPALAIDRPEYAPVADALRAVGAAGAAEEVTRLPIAIGLAKSVAVVGVGAQEPDANALRIAAAAAVRALKGTDSIVIDFPEVEGGAEAALEGAAWAAYSYTAYKSKPDEKSAPVASITLAKSSDEVAVARAAAIAQAAHLVRDLVNMPPNDLFPASFAERAVAAADGLPVAVEILDEDGLRAGGFGGILGVGQGSTRGPRLVTLSYSPAGATTHLALVGKGITFDSGGLSLKPAAGMLGMKYDMTGAATMLAVTLTAARLGLPIRITAFLCLAENLPGGAAQRPNDVITIRGGRTVEVTNTDAEGRLVLADGLVAASELHPDAILDIATLTGAARQAFGTRITPVMGAAEITSALVESAATVGEEFWTVPIGDEFGPLLKSDVADLINTKVGLIGGGMMFAGAFLQEFVGRTGDDESPRIPWGHIDIAGTASNDGASWGVNGKGPTAVAVRSLVAFAERFAR